MIFMSILQVTQAQPVSPEDFDITPTGDVVFSETIDQSAVTPDSGAGLGWDSGGGEIGDGSPSSMPFSTRAYNIEFTRAINRLSQGRQV